ncbi:hypothetical protein, conserved [Babesia bigemina]|uniref:Extracellular matrix-binding ebh n=1 Tax=Babesia bigemina TaxID=5866 RepID=A0A061BT18_BABBI|nr:hypothetical protein, conserved [Babesia bigemina]CDR71648.1 hypothetical protein, conserved [Babesia bigemina]|eukprot:XP_012770595.1 hypothetical protein, conserved [Babesia bigemina]
MISINHHNNLCLSKGYDGQGIVYSDLDRLCDGVMAFLLGVLGAVKDDENVKHYYPVEKMTETLQKIKNSMHNPGGLSKAVMAVSTALGEWDGDLQKKIDKVVKEEGEGTLKALKRKIGENIAAVDKLKSQSLDSVVSTLATTVFDGLDDNVNAVKEAIKKLDGPLQMKVMSDFEKIKMEINHVTKNAKEDKWRMEKLCENVNKVLDKLRHAVHMTTDNEIRRISTTLADNMENIQGHIGIVDEMLKKYVEHLTVWIKNADQTMIDALERVEIILQQVKDTENARTKKDIQEAIRQLTLKAQSLYHAGRAADRLVKELVPKANIMITGLEKVYVNKLWKLKEDVNFAVQDVRKKIGMLGHQLGVKTESDNIKGIMKHIEEEVKFIKGKIGEPMKVPELDDADDSIYKNWQKIKHEVKQVVDSMTGVEDGEITGALKLIAKGVTDYANGFGEEGFSSNVLTEWIGDILKDKDESIVTYKINQYVRLHKNVSQMTDKDDEAVKDAIKKHLPSHIYTEIQEAAVTHLNRSTVGNIADRFQEFADHVELQLKNHLNFSLGRAAQQIEEQLGLTKAKHKYRHNIEIIIRAIVKSLLNNFKQVALELKRFAKTSLINRIESAIPDVEDLGKQLISGNPGEKVDKALEAVKPKIETLQHQLEKATQPNSLGDDSDNAAAAIDVAIHNVTKHPFEGIVASGDGRLLNDINGRLDAYIALNDTMGVLRTQTITALSQIDNAHNDVLKLFKDVTSNIAKLCATIEKASDEQPGGLKKMLGDFRKERIAMVNNRSGLQKIKTDLDTLQKDQLRKLDTAVTNVLHSTLPEAVENCREAIQENIREEVEKAKRDIKQDALKRYVKSKINDLKALGTFVEQRRALMAKTIDNDLKSGIKGFFKNLNADIGEFNNLNADSELPDGASYAKTFFQLLSSNISSQPDMMSFTTIVDAIHSPVDQLLSGLESSEHFDSTFTNNLDTLENAIQSLVPTGFSGPLSPLIDVLKEGITAFVKQLNMAYVSRYSGTSIQWNETENYKRLTADATNCAKAFLTLIPVMCHDVSDLRSKCVVSWSELKTNLRGKNNPLGACLQDAGYKVSESEAVHNGVLRNTISGQTVNEKLKRKTTDAEKLEQLKAWKTSNNRHGDGVTLLDLFDYLHDCLRWYYEVCHLGTLSSKKHPRSIYDMLQWLSGLSYDPVHQELALNGFSDLFEKPEKDESDAELSLSDKDPDTLEAYPENVTATKLSNSLRDVCAYSETVLVAIQGYGHAGGRYACDFNSNADSFVYPADPAKCLEILADVLTRVYEQLCFLLVQCSREYEANSWRDCYYGRGGGIL